MDLKKQINSNFGLIILSISIVIGCLILTEPKTTNPQVPAYGMEESRVRLTGDIAATRIPIDVNSNSNDVTYNSELKIGEGEKLVVRLSTGKKEIIQGVNIIARYFHVSKLLVVNFERNGTKYIKYYNVPIKWGNER